MYNKTVSIVIPSRNEKDYIAKCIDSVLNQDYPSELTCIYVVDGMSEDGTVDIIRDYQSRYNNVFLVENPKRVTPVALNLGIKSSNSDIVIILGAHSYVQKDWVRKNVENLESGDADCTGGPIKSIYENPEAETISLAMMSPFGVGNALFRYSKQKCYVDTVAFGAYKREVFNRIGYFDEELVRNQDDEFNFRLTESGGKILLDPDIKSSYFIRSSYKKLWKQYYQYGFWKVRVIQKHKKPASLRHLVPACFVAAIAAGLILSVFSSIFVNLTIALIGIYLFVAVYFAIKASKDKKFIFGVLLSYFILHFSYGLGFIDGLINFYIFKRKKDTDRNTLSSR